MGDVMAAETIVMALFVGGLTPDTTDTAFSTTLITESAAGIMITCHGQQRRCSLIREGEATAAPALQAHQQSQAHGRAHCNRLRSH